ncbi:arginine--tRNA ligase [Salibacteraceae bacterium]|nr:arginine--tRNA ligase [Salibacteraceae bacterium]HAQ69872.1 arginine--tRNA ligase [Flavobacteriales bacterium]
MTIIEDIAAATISFLKDSYDFNAELNNIQIDQTRKEFSGDYTLVVFPFVKALRMKPEDAGSSIGEYLVLNIDAVESFNVIKGFLNLSLSDAYWTQELVRISADSNWLTASTSKDLVLVEYSSPNTNKPLHLGHLRNNFLGHSVSLIKGFDGNKVVKTQIINDRGIHICKSMFAWKMHGKGETPESSGLKGDKLVGKYYVMFDEHYRAQINKLVKDGMEEEQAKKEAHLMKKVQEMLLNWENGDPETVALWKMMNSWVYEGFNKTYTRMGVEFDKLYYESETYLKGKNIVQDGLSKGLFFKKDNESVWIDLEPDGLDQKLLIRADGTTVYMTQDIGTAVQRYEDYPELKQVVYTVGDEQDYHFKVLFLILEKLGYEWASSCRHLSYGMVDLPSGKMKSREGTVVDADDLMDEVVEAARASSEEKGKLDDMSEAEQKELFEILGVGALKFYLLRVDPRKRMMFDPTESVSLNGDTGPFVQYTYARCKAVLRKAGDYSIGNEVELVEKERQLLRNLLEFRNTVSLAADEMNPATISNYCIEIAKTYNQFYHDNQILKADESLKGFRLALTALTAETIKTAMGLLGIRVPERM